jgi:pimeloyl-ACP methyl ester carboxylesterase
MTARLLLMTAVPVLLYAVDDTPTLTIRGKKQSIALLASPSGAHRHAVLFLPGDGGWRGLAIKIGQVVSTWGYDVYGFNTKAYLETFTQGKSCLTRAEMQRDLGNVVAWIRSRGAQDVTLLGWSEGAGMAVLAAHDRAADFDGVLTLGLPESAVLGWSWRDTLAVVAGRASDQPRFSVRPLLPAISQIPLWMIHGSQDEYTDLETASELHALANEPKRLIVINGANHRFDGRREELFRAIHEGLDWVRNSSR